MNFISLDYLYFLVAVFLLYFSLEHKYRWILLLAASYYFYACWNPVYLVLILLSTLVDYYCGIKIEQNINDKSNKNKYLALSLLVNLGLLFTFKYSNFVIDNFNFAFDSFNLLYKVPELKVLLPVGISFYTFQTLSYTIDVYRGEKKAERNLGIFALYVSFFPQLVAGPIERSTRLLPQFFEKHNIDYQRISSGCKLILWGVIKKVLVADYLAVFVNQAYAHHKELSAIYLILATYFFAFQIYCDFSAYSDIAIGSARILGFDLMTNFKEPYFAKSLKEFWSRWHISLTTWFKDYIYIPLGGNRQGQTKWLFNILAIFIISGIWHGANWTFIVWGAIHGLVYLTTELIHKVLNKNKFQLPQNIFLNFIQIFFTFNVVCLSWIFFRAENIKQAFEICSKVFSTKLAAYLEQVQSIFITADQFLNLNTYSLELGILVILALLICEKLKYHPAIKKFLNKEFEKQNNTIKTLSITGRYLLYSVSAVLVILFFEFSKQDFIYFQF